ncbi:GNAT family N-acetyltransferase [Tepidamorphus sp. 3E244]|uniref:GNAT family N-acetyltransferase n=1 Tax=Tepidamorphus sp. 3E244 TaxID=3385498 RepID=UPI0038FD2BD9
MSLSNLAANPSSVLPSGAIIRPEQPDDEAAVEALNALSFGPGRFAKTAYRLRRNNPPLIACNRVCIHDCRLVGAVCFSPLRVGSAPAVLLGPLAVHPDFKNKRIGLSLMLAGMRAAQEAGEALVILVGDPPYYARAGFVPVPRGQMAMPGPVDYGRLLACELKDGALEAACGAVRADPRRVAG